MIHRYSILIFFYFIISECIAQQSIAVGQWRTHFNYSEGKEITMLNNNIFLATPNALFYINFDDLSLHRLGVLEGLNDIGIQTIETNDKTQSIIITYLNSNIDLFQNDKIYNIPDIAKKQISGDKSIYNIHCEGDYAFLACGFGIVILDVKKHLIKDTWFFQKNNQTIQVKDVTIHNDTIYASTSNGLFSNYLSNQMISQFSSWKEENHIAFINNDIAFVESFENKLYAVIDTTFLKIDTIYLSDSLTYIYDTIHKEDISLVYRFINQDWIIDSVFGFEKIKNFRSINHRLVVTRGWGAHAYADVDGVLKYSNSFGSDITKDAVVDKWGMIWIADERYGIVRQIKGGSQKYLIPGPASDGAWALDIVQSKLCLVSGAHIEWYPIWNPANISIFYNEMWNNILHYEEAYNNKMAYGALDVLINPTKINEIFVGCYMSGLLHVVDGKVVNIYNTSNSSLEEFGGRTQVNALAFDHDYNLWMLNSQSSKPLSVRTKDGKWQSFSIPYSNGEIIGKLLVDKRGWLWMTGNRETSLLIFNPSGTPLNTSDDQLVRLNTNLTEEEGSFETIYALAEDKEGNIWIGTNKGIKIYFSPSQLLNNPSILPYAPRVIMDSITELLLNYEIIKCIKVDQGNRKWIGTDNAGVFLLSENGETELLHFTTDNSPLLSNSINDIEIDGNSGEVFIATEKGLISFRYTATDAKEDYEEIKIFPNPVREGFVGYISISGLKDNSEVKITDAMGGLVYRTKSNGGTAVWDGFRFDGRKASTGVYFVFVSDINGKEKKAGKILFIK